MVFVVISQFAVANGVETISGQAEISDLARSAVERHFAENPRLAELYGRISRRNATRIQSFICSISMKRSG